MVVKWPKAGGRGDGGAVRAPSTAPSGAPSTADRRGARSLAQVHLPRPAVTLAALAALAAGTSGDVSSALDRLGATPDGPRPTVTSGPPGRAPRPAPATSAPTTTTTEPPPQWELAAAGDVLMDHSEPAGLDPFSGIVPPLAEADVSVVNVEMSVAASGTAQPGKEFTFRAPPTAAVTMAAAGIDVANLANNHARDFGPDAMLETVRHLREAGVATVGAGADADEAFRPAELDVGGVRVAVIGATDVLPAGWAAGPGPGVASARGRRLVEAVAAAAASHDVVVVAVHWGTELAPCPSPRQISLGDELVAAGADVVVGHHPHVLQPVVSRGGGVIAYSLGNFVWHPRSAPQGDTGVLEVRFRGATATGFTFQPHVIDDRGAPAPAGAEAAARIEEAVTRACPLDG